MRTGYVYTKLTDEIIAADRLRSVTYKHVLLDESEKGGSSEIRSNITEKQGRSRETTFSASTTTVIAAKASFKCPYGSAEASFSKTWTFGEVDRYA